MKRFFLLFSILIAFCCNAQTQHAVFNTTPFTDTVDSSSFDFVGVGDINGDGLNDIAGATAFYSSPNHYNLIVWLQGANGQLQLPVAVPYALPGYVSAFTVCDLYKDGTAEVIIGLNAWIKIYSWTNNELKIVDSFQTHPNALHTAIATADFDEDGFIDIAASHFNTDRITVTYQKGAGGAKWDPQYYVRPGTGNAHIVAGRFGGLQKTALVYASKGNSIPIKILTFTSARAVQDEYDMKLPSNTHSSSVAIVRKDADPGHNELWATYGGNWPSGKVAIWRGLQMLPDTSIVVTDIPQPIQAANLDCDEDDEAVIMHSGFRRVTVFTDSQDKYIVINGSHFEDEALALGDVNNDGRIDICIAGNLNGGSKTGLIVLYNSTPFCWPAAVNEINSAARELGIYPNPSYQTTTITYNGNGVLVITDAQGRAVYNSSFKQKAVVDISDLAAGIYFAILRTDDGQVLTRKLVKE